MTSEEYAARDGGVCPFCGEPNILMIDGPFLDHWKEGRVSADIECHTCGEEWTEIYKLVGYEEVK
jgi:hypothetical protein